MSVQEGFLYQGRHYHFFQKHLIHSGWNNKLMKDDRSKDFGKKNHLSYQFALLQIYIKLSIFFHLSIFEI